MFKYLKGKLTADLHSLTRRAPYISKPNLSYLYGLLILEQLRVIETNPRIAHLGAFPDVTMPVAIASSTVVYHITRTNHGNR